jgi:hypothetical protein
MVVFAIRPKFAGSNTAESDGFLKAIKILSTTFFGYQVKPSAPCKIFRHVKDPLRCDRDADRENSAVISRPFLPPSLLGVCSATREKNSDR